jgi:hypothetical protein
MQDDPYQNPLVAQFLPPKPAPSVTPAIIAQYLNSLQKPNAPPLVSAPVPERSVLEKIADATRRVRKAIADRKLNKSAQLEWTSRLFFWLRPFYGKQSQLIQTLDQWRKEISKAQLPTEDFVSRVEQVEHYLYSFNRRSLISLTGSNGAKSNAYAKIVFMLIQTTKICVCQASA